MNRTRCGSGRRVLHALVRVARTAVLVALTIEAARPAFAQGAACAGCHASAHGAALRRAPAAAAYCGDCHERAHAAIIGLYDGTADPELLRPDPMSAARVGCAGCHTDTTFAAVGAARLAALDRACTSCHGRTFIDLLPRWRAGLDWRLAAVSRFVLRATDDVDLARSPVAQRPLRAARASLTLLRSGDAVHNVRGADALLRATLDSTEAAYRVARLTVPARPSLGPDPGRVSCMGCHYGIELARDSAFGAAFDHGAHVLRGELACTSCHSAADYLVPGQAGKVDPRHGRTTVTAASCDRCHHAPDATIACRTCHAGDRQMAREVRVVMPLHLRPANSPTTRNVSFRHADHPDVACASCHTSRSSVRSVAGCNECHEAHHTRAARCAACHGSDMLDAHDATVHLRCASCHAPATVALLTPDRSFCVSCHADRANHKRGRECTTCHMQRTPSELRQRLLRGSARPPA